MKNKLMRVFMPMVVITLGVFGAISTSAINQKTTAFADRWGYTHIEGENCVKDIMCSFTPGFTCKSVSGDQLYGLDQNGVTCPIALSKKQ